MNKISIVMATFNGEKFLKKQLDSILEQTVIPDEIIIVDDKSTDNTMELLNDYAASFPFVKVFQNETRLGPIKNFEKCLIHSTGDFIFFSDQDDVWSPQKIESMLSKAADEVCCYSDSYIIDEDENIIKDSEIIDHHGVCPSDGNNFLYFFFTNSVSGHNLMIHRSIVNDLLPFPENTMFDQWIALLTSAKYRLKYIPERYCYHRIHKTNFVNNPELRKKRDKNSRCQRLKERFERTKELLLFLHARGVPETKLRLLNRHVASYDSGFYSFRLFFYLLNNYKAIFTGAVSWVRINTIYKFCRQKRGMWLPSLRF